MAPAAVSLWIFFAALIAVVTPGYVGELVKAHWLRQRCRIPMRSSAPLIFFERFFDALALATLLLAASWLSSAKGLAALGICLILLAGLWRFFCPACVRLAAFLGRLRIFLALGASRAEVPPDTTRLRSVRFFATAFLLSLVAWAPGALIVRCIVVSLGRGLPWDASMNVFAGGTLLGGASLLPAGIGVTGSSFVVGLRQGGFPMPDAVLGAALLRILTLWLSVVIGGAVYFAGRRRGSGQSADVGGAFHFKEMGETYDAQIPAHVRDLLLERKTSATERALRQTSGDAPLLRGLDVGCGTGRHAEAMSQRGFPMVGLDLSAAQAREARKRGCAVVVGDALSIPFPDNTFDFAYAVNALHHLSDAGEQRTAFAEIARVLKPGGRFLLHEINVHNPLFRIYMGYVFPLLRNIDTGAEHWIRPAAAAWADSPYALERTEHFTFVPDFLPKFLLRPALWLERFLEATPVRSWSAHYMSVLRKKE